MAPQGAEPEPLCRVCFEQPRPWGLAGLAWVWALLILHHGNPWEPELIIPMVVIGTALLVANYLDLFVFRRGSRAD